MESSHINNKMDKYIALNGRNRPILCIGLCCLDIVSEVKEFPHEDTDQRCIDQRWQRGGNAANNSTVLGLLGAQPYYLGTIADSHEKSFLLGDFAVYGVNTEHVVLHPGYSSPASCVIVSAHSGSRTIIHSNKGLPELELNDLMKLPVKTFHWVHFEGRNVSNVSEMMKYINRHNQEQDKLKGMTIRVSVEIEKAKPELECLIPLADVVFVAKDYAQYKGYADMKDTIEHVNKVTKKGSVIICPWGEKGASAREENGTLVFSPAFPPEKVVDTLGAGDTFNGATIFALNTGHSLKDAITFGCRVAGTKVGQRGWGTLKDSIMDLLDTLPKIPSPGVNDLKAAKRVTENS